MLDDSVLYTKPNAPITVHLFILSENRVLLQLAIDSAQNNVFKEIVGQNSDNERVFDGAIKLAQSVANINLSPNALHVFGLLHEEDSGGLHFYVAATIVPGEKFPRANNETQQLFWCPLEQLPTNTDPSTRDVLSDFRRGVRFNSLEDVSYRTKSDSD